MMGRPSGETPNGELIAKLRSSPPHCMTQKQFAEAICVSVRKIQDVEAGKATSTQTMQRIAQTLGVPFERLMETERIVTIPCSTDGMTVAEMAKWFREIHEQAGLTDGVRVVKTESGSLKVTVKLSLEDAKKLDAAFRDGKLIGVLGVSEVPKWWHRFATRRVTSYTCSTLSIICGLSMLFPRWTLSFCIAGTVLSLAGAACANKVRSRLILPVVGLLLNVGGIVVWATRADGEHETERLAPKLEGAVNDPRAVIAKRPLTREEKLEAKRKEIENETAESIRLIDEWVKNPTEENRNKLTDFLQAKNRRIAEENLSAIAEVFEESGKPSESYDMGLPEGRLHISMKARNGVLVNKVVAMPKQQQIKVTFIRAGLDKITVKFTPDILQYAIN